MRVLLAIDGSTQSDLVVAAAAARPWPDGTSMELLTVVHSAVPMLPDPAFAIAAAHHVLADEQRQHAPEWLHAAAERIRRAAPAVTVTTRTLEGLPRETIVSEARALGADLIMVGSHGYGPVRRALLGSVARSVMAAAPCSVEMVRAKACSDATENSARSA